MPYVIKYPSFVNTNNIKSNGANGYRFLLSIPFNNVSINKKELIVILKNPSSANLLFCDTTILRVCNVAHNNGYSGVIILNLFPYRATYAKDVQNFYANPNYNQIMNVNLNIIITTCLNKDVVFAWGTDTIGGRKQYPNYYDSAIHSITSNITSNTYYVKRCSCKNKSCTNPVHNLIRYPLHGLRWENNSILNPY